MAKVILEFEVYEDDELIVMHTHCVNAFNCLNDLAQRMRDRMKYGEVSDEEHRFLDEMRALIFEVPGTFS